MDQMVAFRSSISPFISTVTWIKSWMHITKHDLNYFQTYLFGQITLHDSLGNLGNISNLGSQVRSHSIDICGQILPYSIHIGRNDGLAAKFAISPDFSCDST